ncbi:MAG: hypothetical protein ACLTSZ_07995 [Lachnospiraceae bacterium]
MSPEMITEALPEAAETPDTGAPVKQSRPKIKKTAKHPQQALADDAMAALYSGRWVMMSGCRSCS